MAARVVKTVIRRSVDWKDEIKRSTAANNTAGATVSVGDTAYIITVRKIKVSATDFRLWVTPSAFVTDTVKRLAAKVRQNRTPQGMRPPQPNAGSANMEMTKSKAETAATPLDSARLFQFPCSMDRTISLNECAVIRGKLMVYDSELRMIPTRLEPYRMTAMLSKPRVLKQTDKLPNVLAHSYDTVFV